MGDSVKVAVRVRPFNPREIQNDSKLCVSMSGPTTTLFDPEDPKNNPHIYTFDYSYWSHNPKDAHFASQQTVFNDLGIGVLENAWQGYNVSLFAYGQTGSGKSFSMVGYGEERGIIPLACEEIFRRISETQSDEVKYRVEASMLEIYNEQVRDLFNPDSNKPGGLRVREHPQTGPYVENLASIVVKSYPELSKLMEEGSLARTVAATNMNKTSSRAHTLFQIIFTQTTINRAQAKAADKVSKINLVDLAGSEKAKSTGAEGDRLKEGSAINKSLSSLGDCISALAEKCSGKKKDVFIPYRNSVLTWIMKESLGGNAKTIMIAAISPADINFQESLSTLRYANRAKQIKTSAKVNEDPNLKMIKDLQAEIARLKQLIEGTGTGVSPSAGVAMDEFNKMREQLLESQSIIAKLQLSNEEKEKQSEAISKNREKALEASGVLVAENMQIPHLVNLNEDPLMSEALIYAIKSGQTRVGRKGADPPADIQLGGLGVAVEHCIFENNGSEEIYITPCSGASLFVNGEKVTEKTKISQGFRIIIGNNHVFRFVNPEEAARLKRDREARGEEATSLPAVLDWQFAQRELAEVQGRMLKVDEEREKEFERQMKEMQEKLEREKQEQQAKLEAEKREIEMKSKKMMEEIAAKEREIQERMNKEDETAVKKLQAQLAKQQAEAEAAMKKQQEEMERRSKELEQQLQEQKRIADEMKQKKMKEQKERNIVEANLLKVLPMVTEANAIAEELKKPIVFEAKLIRYRDETKIGIKVFDKETGNHVFWDDQQFTERVYLMRELYQYFIESLEQGLDFEMQDNGPFDMADEPQLIGMAMVYLKTLSHNIDSELMTPILDYSGHNQGELYVSLKPCNAKGDEDDVEYAEDPKELIGKSVHFKLNIPYARGLDRSTCKDVSVRYKFFDHDWVSTAPSDRVSINPDIKFSKMYTISPVTDDYIIYLQNNPLIFEVYGSKADSTRPQTTNVIRGSATKLEKVQKEKENAIADMQRLVQERDELALAKSNLEEQIKQQRHDLESKINEIVAEKRQGGSTQAVLVTGTEDHWKARVREAEEKLRNAEQVWAKDRNRLETQISKMDAEVASATRNVEATKRTQDELERRIKEAQQQAEDAKHKAESAEKRKCDLELQIKLSDEQGTQFRNQIEELLRLLELERKELAKTKVEKEEAERKLKMLESSSAGTTAGIGSDDETKQLLLRLQQELKEARTPQKSKVCVVM